jgi:hypothetical protein
MPGWHDIDGQRCIARLKVNLTQSSWQLFDRDIMPDMPEHLAGLSFDEWLAAMETMVPGFIGAGRVVVPSTTARVTVGGAPMEANGVHVFVRGQQADAWQAFGANLLMRSFLTGHGFMRPKYSKDTGDVIARVPWSIFDPTTFSCERLVYDGKPSTRGKTLDVLDPVVESSPGGLLDNTAMDLSDTEMADVQETTHCTLALVKRTQQRLGADGRVSSVDVMVPMKTDTETLKPDSVFEVKVNGHAAASMTFQEYVVSDLDKVRCQTAFRESTSWNGFLTRQGDGECFHYDNGAHIKYTCPELGADAVFANAMDRLREVLSKLKMPKDNMFGEPYTLDLDDMEQLPDVETVQGPDIPAALFNPPGLVGDIVKVIGDGAYKQAPLMDVSAALFTVLMATQNGFLIDAYRTPLTLYLLVLAETGTDKETRREAPYKLLKGDNFKGRVIASAASGKAVLHVLDESPVIGLMLDEFGRKLQAVSGAGKDPHTSDFITIVMELFGKGCKTYHGHIAVNGESNVDPVDNPSVNIYGTTTMRSLMPALVGDDIASGFLNRMLLVNIPGGRTVRNDDISHDVPADVSRRLETIVGMNDPGTRLGAMLPAEEGGDFDTSMFTRVNGKAFWRIQFTSAGFDLLQGFRDEVDELEQRGDHGAMWSRAHQHALVVAGLLAVGGKDPTRAVIGVEAARWAVLFVKWSIESWLTLIGDELADNRQHAEWLKVMKYIRDAGIYADNTSQMCQKYSEHLRKGFAPRPWLVYQAKLSSKALDAAISTLQASDQIEVTTQETGGSKKLMLYRGVT